MMHYHFSVVTNETYQTSDSRTSRKKALQRQYEKVLKEIERIGYKIYNLDELIKTSSSSRRTKNYLKKKKEHPSRPLNKFMIFRKNYEEGLRQKKEATNIEAVSKDAATEWMNLKGSQVSALFEEISKLAELYHKVQYPDYKFKPCKKKSSLSSPELLSSPEDSSSTQMSPTSDQNLEPEDTLSTNNFIMDSGESEQSINLPFFPDQSSVFAVPSAGISTEDDLSGLYQITIFNEDQNMGVYDPTTLNSSYHHEQNMEIYDPSTYHEEQNIEIYDESTYLPYHQEGFYDPYDLYNQITYNNSPYIQEQFLSVENIEKPMDINENNGILHDMWHQTTDNNITPTITYSQEIDDNTVLTTPSQEYKLFDEFIDCNGSQ
ncbi:8081_t:CDS:1 [Acaulospora morrowiae]|uniref:8081_t:CDS:1 n=1 Tax=Acaulospora morrowiae TaxID=94023 RepID=A0A9N8WEC9_9GLOM|nr:8081_t:CDS:1 [Acaulospora morrowiae]